MVLHRPVLDGRRKVANYLRALIAGDRRDTLRAIFVDSGCQLLSCEIIDWVARPFQSDGSRHILDSAYVAGASAIILARGQMGGEARITAAERRMAANLARLGGAVGIYLLDYLVVARAGTKGMMFIRSEES